MQRSLHALVCAIAVTAVVYGCEAPPNESATETTPMSGEAEGTAGATGTADVADIVAAPERYLGQTVTVVADVEEVLGPNSFRLDEDAPVSGGVDNDLLVLSKKAGGLANIDDQWLNNKVRVTGTVGKWTLVELEREIGWDLDRELEAEVEGAAAVLIADSVKRVED